MSVGCVKSSRGRWCCYLDFLWRLGEEFARKDNLDAGIYDGEKFEALYLSLAELALREDPKTFARKYNDHDFMGYTFEDYQIVLSNPILARRIIKVLPQGNAFGRVLHVHEQDKYYAALFRSLAGNRW